MTKDIASLKLDFKIDERGIVRIIDLGDAFGADKTGFSDTPLESQLLGDIHEATGATLATVFGELPYAAMQSESIHVPLALRQHPSAGRSLVTDDLPSGTKRILPYSHYGRLSSYVSYAWGKQNDAVITAPAALVASEMHKILWYFLMQKHMAPIKYQPVLYWSNNTSPTEIDLSAIDLQHGSFIKIADRSDGGGDEVYYAKNKNELLKIINQLHKKFKVSKEQFKKHIFVIEPAYMTLIQHQEKTYNVTGRAFVTLIHDKDTQTLDVKIAAAKWMLPLTALEENMTQNQMLSNVEHSIKMLDLSAEELHALSSGILSTYGEVFKAGIINADLIGYCHDHPYMKSFMSCLRPNSVYAICLDLFYRSNQNSSIGKSFLTSQIANLIARDHINNFNQLLKYSYLDMKLFTSAKPTLDGLMKRICSFSFFENYVAHIKTADRSCHDFFPFMVSLVKNEELIKSTLDRLILQYLKLKNKYDIQDTNRALRQAAAISDITVMKLLIYTRRADVNALSSTNKTALDYALISKNESQKEQSLRLLEQVGAQRGKQKVVESSATNIGFTKR